jgi:hypothetical protein
MNSETAYAFQSKQLDALKYVFILFAISVISGIIASIMTIIILFSKNKDNYLTQIGKLWLLPAITFILAVILMFLQ